MKKYETLTDYTLIAQKCVKKMYPSMAKEILNNEEAFGDIVSAIATADWKWDHTRTGKTTGKHKSRYAYRNQCAIWAIKTYISSKKKKHKHHSINNTISNEDNTYDQMIVDHSAMTPLEHLLSEEESRITKEYVRSLFNQEILSQKQIDQIKLYYFDNKTLSQIGKIYGVTREAIRQNIKKGLKSIGDKASV